MYDLHCHSHCSDGALSPIQLVRRAVTNGITRLAITDHDTYAGFLELQDLPSSIDENINFFVIPGIELSVNWQGDNLHLLVLDFDPNSKTMKNLVEDQQHRRKQRADIISQRLEKRLHLQNLLLKAKQYSGSKIPSRPDFAQVLVDEGKTKDLKAAFANHLGRGTQGDVKQMWPDLTSVVEQVSTVGGLAVLAHPESYKYTRAKLRRCLLDLKLAGGKGVELVQPQLPLTKRDQVVSLASELNLHLSCGSDFHSATQAWRVLGRVPPMPSEARPIWELFSGNYDIGMSL